MTNRILLAAAFLSILAGVAAAQPGAMGEAGRFVAGPIVGGRQLQPTQQEVSSREKAIGLRGAAPRRASSVQSDVDLLYNEVMRASAPAAAR